MTAAEPNAFQRGENITFPLVVLDNAGSVIDIAGGTLTAEIHYRGRTQITLAVGSGLTIVDTNPPQADPGDPQDPHATGALTDAQTLAMPDGRTVKARAVFVDSGGAKHIGNYYWLDDIAAGTAYNLVLNGTQGPTGRSSDRIWTFDALTADADPGSGNVRLNHADPSLATAIYIDDLDGDGTAAGEWLDLFDDSTSAVKGSVTLRSRDDRSIFAEFTVTGAVIDKTGYREIPVAAVANEGALAGVLLVSFTRTGDKGDKGDEGDAGPTGNTGPTGPRGETPVPILTFATGTTDVDPGAGKIAFDNAALASVTTLYIDNLNAAGGSISAWLDAFDDGGVATNRGMVHITKVGSPQDFAIYKMSGATVDGTGYRKVTVAHVSSAGSFSADDELALTFVPAGDTGGVFAIWAEEGADLNAGTDSGFQWSFGNGATGLGGAVLIGMACTLEALVLKTQSTATGVVEIYKNSVATGVTVSISAATETVQAGLNLSFNAGDWLNFKTISGSGGSVCNISAWFRTAGAKGATGDTGDALESLVVDATTARTLALTDRNSLVRMTSASANTVTVPPNSSVAFGSPTVISIEQSGIGSTTIVAGSGVTINSRLTLTLAGRYAVASLIQTATNVWTLVGDLSE